MVGVLSRQNFRAFKYDAVNMEENEDRHLSLGSFSSML